MRKSILLSVLSVSLYVNYASVQAETDLSKSGFLGVHEENAPEKVTQSTSTTTDSVLEELKQERQHEQIMDPVSMKSEYLDLGSMADITSVPFIINDTPIVELLGK